MLNVVLGMTCLAAQEQAPFFRDTGAIVDHAAALRHERKENTGFVST
jgi:hypothetical protein